MAQYKVTGLSELRIALTRAQMIEPKELRLMMRSIGEVVVEKARPRMDSLIHDHRATGALESSLKAASTVRSASVVLGTPVRVAYAGWWEFGGPKAKSHRPPNREYLREGRTLYPTLAEERPAIQAATELVVDTLARMIMETG